jgi:hypothetical protein
LADATRCSKVQGMGDFGRVILILGGVLLLLGAALIIGEKLGLGRLPGDIVIERKGFRFSAPIATSIILSLVLTLLANLFFRR